MITSDNGIALIQKYEGCELKAYKCPAGIPTIGYGQTFYPNGKKVQIGDTITPAQAIEGLKLLLPNFEKVVRKNIKVVLNQNQFDALVSHTYNTGGSTTLFALINSNSSVKTFWTTKYITGGGKVLKGLVARRLEEYNLFVK